MKIKLNAKPSRESRRIMKALRFPDGESDAYKKSKETGYATIVEDGWIVRVYADDTRERIKYIGETEVKIEQKDYKL